MSRRASSDRGTRLAAVLGPIARTAAQLCEATDALIYLVDGDRHRLVAQHGKVAQPQRIGDTHPIRRDTPLGRAVLSGRPVHVPDITAARQLFTGLVELQLTVRGVRTVLAVPLLYEGAALGGFVIRRTHVQPFTRKQISLLKTFADQAAIAIENAQLSEALEARNRELADALERETATGEILRAISAAPTDLQSVLETVAASAARLCDSVDAQIFRIEGNILKLVMSHGPIPETVEPRPISRGSVNGRAVLERRTVHVHDLTAESETEFPEGKSYQKRFGHRTIVATPLLREGAPIGTITIRRMEMRPFSPKEITLLETFADQAVIAIENVRLVTELQARNRELTDALERETATSEVLRAISSSPTSLSPVLETIAARAAVLCGAFDTVVFLLDRGRLQMAAHHGPIPITAAATVVPYDRTTVNGRAVIDGQPIQVADLPAEAAEFPTGAALASGVGYRTVLAVPLIRQGQAIGTVSARRTQADEFTPQQIALLKTFADQAVIAIENVRLFTELQSRNRDLTQSLDRQVATSEILRVISQSQMDVQPVFDTIVRSAVRLCGAIWGGVYRVDGDLIHSVAHDGFTGEQLAQWRSTWPRPVTASGPTSEAIRLRRVVRLGDIDGDATFDLPGEMRANLRARGTRSLLSVPMFRQDHVVGAISLAHRTVDAFSDQHVELLQTFADQAVIAIENVRLFTQLQERNRDLTEALEQQTAVGEILQAISSSPTDLQPTLDAIARNAVTVCGATDASVFLREGDDLVAGSHRGAIGFQNPGERYRLTRGTVPGRAVIAAQPIQVPDFAATDDFPEGKVLAQRYGVSAGAAVPLLRTGIAIGALLIRRAEAGAFSDKQMRSLATFADQAVIAIENVRLFTELEARNRALSEALEQQTATAEILRVISGSPTDLSPTFDTILSTASRLCRANLAALWRFDGTHLIIAAHHNASPQYVETLIRHPLLPSRHGPARRAALERRVVHIADMTTEPGFSPVALQFERARTVLAVPLLRDDALVGVIAMWRREVQPFTEQQIALVKTFADQAVIAIENVRLFTELQDKNRAVTEALEQQTATSEILRVISRSPTDLEPVFSAIIGNAVRLCGGVYGIAWRYENGLIHVGAMCNFSPDDEQELRARFPRPVRDGDDIHRTIQSGRMINTPDIDAATDLPASFVANLRHRQVRSGVLVPMVRDDDVVGAIGISHRDVNAFSASRIELLETFADQAVIAIENVRLFKELQAKNANLTAALEQQTATAEILRTISRSYTDVQPVFQAIVDSATRLLRGHSAVLSRIVDDRIDLAAYTHTDEAGDALLESFFPVPLHSSGSDSRPIRERVIGQRIPYNVADVETDPRVGERGRASARARGYRSQLVVPMLRDNEPIGTLAVTRREPGAFSEEEVALLQTFADQAVIAIENVRLFRELQDKNTALSESLEQQTATSEILRVISQSPTNVDPVFEAILASSTQLCEADYGILFLAEGDGFRAAAFRNVQAEFASVLASFREFGPKTGMGRLARDKRPIHIADLFDDDAYREGDPARLATINVGGVRTWLGVPLLKGTALIGAIVIYRKEQRAFTNAQITLVQTFADQAVIAIENVRLFTELQARNRELTVALEQQTATGEILRVISQSQTDVQPVFDTIVESAARLCNGLFSQLTRFDGELIHLVATHNWSSEAQEAARRLWPMRPSSDLVTSRSILERTVLNVADVTVEYQAGGPQELARDLGYRSVLSVPMLRESVCLGAIAVARAEPGPFSDNQVALLKTFADQAVIAIENVRLFTQLETRTRDLTRSVEQLTALGDVGQAVSSTLDVETVLTTIASRASQLAGARTCTVYEYDEPGEAFHLRATHNVDEKVLALTRVRPIRRGEGVAGRVAETHAPVQVEDITADQAYQGALREVLLGAGVRAVLAVPLLREDRLIGALIVTGNAPGRFAKEVIALLQTFATQSAIAIQNARLFRELEAKGRELEQASRHKSQFLANMSHELRTPMNAILGYTELIADGIYGEVPDRMKEVLTRVEGSGRHLLGLINDVLDLSKIEAGQLTLSLAEYSMKEVVEAVVAAAEPLAAEKHLRLIVDVAPGLPTARGDQRRLAQVLLNLVGNAIKFTDAGHVALRVGAAADLFTLAVSDTGPGIAPADQERIFEEFQQADTSTTRPKGGTGLGLAIARRIVAMHGGRLWVESTLGEGATFRLTLPVRVEQQVVREATS